MSEEVLVYERVGKVGKVMLNRPKVRNALNRELVEGFGNAICKADADPETNVILLCAAGEKAFTAGFDLKESIEAPIPPRKHPDGAEQLARDLGSQEACYRGSPGLLHRRRRVDVFHVRPSDRL